MFKKMAVLTATAFLGISFHATASAQSLEWTAGQIGGGWYGQASGLAQLITEEYQDLNIRVVPGGGTANPTKVQRGVSQIGTGLGIFTKSAYDGKYLYEGTPHGNLRMIGQSFSDLPLHLIKAEDAPIDDFEELFTQADNVAIAVTKAGSSDEQTFRYVMDYYGTSYEELRDERGWKINHADYAAMASQFADGQVDYVFLVLGLPGAAVIEMTQARDADVVAWPEQLMKDLSGKYGYTIGDIPAGTYPEAQEGEAVPTLVMETTVMVSSEVDEETVYKITKAICGNVDRLPDIHASMAVFDCERAAQHHVIPLHAGAEKYYEEQGYL